MSKAVMVALVIGFFCLFLLIFDDTITRFYPEPKTDYSLGNLLGDQSSQQKEFPVRNIVIFMIYLVVGFVLTYVGLQNKSAFLANVLAWPGISLVITGIYKLKYSSIYSFITGSLSPPLWTFFVEWLAIAGLFYLAYWYEKKNAKT